VLSALREKAAQLRDRRERAEEATSTPSPVDELEELLAESAQDFLDEHNRPNPL
jgi:hypothetical protein